MKAEEIVEKFNKQFPVGATVGWRSVSSDKMPHRDYTVQYPAIVQHGQPVAWFAEKSGMVSIEPRFVNYEKGKVMERFADYFLRYTADVPADEVNAHDKFSRECPCNPDVLFDSQEGWHTLTHQSMELCEQ